jgi:hypothetical protein
MKNKKKKHTPQQRKELVSNVIRELRKRGHSVQQFSPLHLRVNGIYDYYPTTENIIWQDRTRKAKGFNVLLAMLEGGNIEAALVQEKPPLDIKPSQTSPSHYKGTAIIDFCNQHKIGFSAGNFLKYTLRYNKKNGVEDLNKALFYLEHCPQIETTEKQLKEALDLLNLYKPHDLIVKVHKEFWQNKKVAATKHILNLITEIERGSS